MKLSNLAKRLLFVAWAAPLGWWVISSTLQVVPKSFGMVYPGHIAVILIILTACYEYNRMLSIFYPVNGFWLSYLWLGAQFVLYLWEAASFPFNLSIYVLLILVAIEAFIWGRKNMRRRWVRSSLLFSGTAFLYIAGISLMSFYQEPFQSMFRKIGTNPMLSQMGIVTVIASIFMCDSGAYIVGSIWGKTHFSSISPKKTIEGSIGGLVASILVCSIMWYFFSNPMLPVWLGVVLGILIGIFAQIGDLLVSLMKRYFRVKDASHLIPG
ncbi:MAG: phosphatidate cytidylyltransferase, partial [Fibrobacter sp.]|nr:phosphatidate cytidylyltransferase [Fibrobacter sp.]